MGAIIQIFKTNFLTYKSIKMEQMTITPKMAEKILEKNIINNRKPTSTNVARYAEMMNKGLWINYHVQPIILSHENELMDGQHRLLAVIKSGKTIKFNIVYADKSIMATIDDGKKRTPGDACKVAGIPNANQYSGIMTLYTNLKNQYTGLSKQNLKTLSKLELVEFYYENKSKINRIINTSQGWYNRSRLLTWGTYGALYMLFEEKNSDYAELFFDQLSSGKGIVNNSMYLLRQRLINEKSNVKILPQPILIALIIKTWNAVISGKELKLLSYNPLTEKYPEINS